MFLWQLSLPAGGQYAQDGLCINFPVDFQELYQDPDCQNDKDIMIVKPASSTALENSQINIENVVWKTVLQNCLTSLKKRNKHYTVQPKNNARARSGARSSCAARTHKRQKEVN